MFSTVLAPVDCSVDSARGLRLASTIARRHSARLVVVYVDRLPAEGELTEFGTARSDASEAEWRAYLAARGAAVEARLDRFVAAVEPVAAGECVVAHGQPAEAIEAIAVERRADLIVMAPRGGGYGQQFSVGSVSVQVAAEAGRPVLVARSRSGEPAINGAFVRPLVAVSRPLRARQTLETTLSLCAPEAAVDLLHVLEPSEIEVGPALPGGFQEAVERSRGATRARLAALCGVAAARGIACSAHVETGDPSFGILCRVEQAAHDVLVVSRKTDKQGRGALTTPAYRMLTHAPVPVLVVPEPGHP